MRFIFEGLLLGGVFILVDVENWLGNVECTMAIWKINKKDKNESDSTLNFHY